MADTQGSGSKMFRPSAMSRITSADDLDKYLKVTNPSAWVVLFAALALIAGLFVWSALAVIPTTVKAAGIIDGKEVTCWVDESTYEKISDDNISATVLDVKATNAKLDDIPWSKAEVLGFVASDYLLESLQLGDWSYMVSFTLEKEVDGIGNTVRSVPVVITVSETNPLSLMLGQR